MVDHRRLTLNDDLEAVVCFTDVSDGDFGVLDPTPGLESRRRSIVDRPWSWVRQVHEATVLEVVRAGQHAGVEADGLVTATLGCPIAITTADCAPLVLLANSGIAVVHVGWRGLAAGIVEVAAKRLSEIGGAPVASLLGPTISPGAYEFGRDELQLVADRLGPGVEGRTVDGRAALDVPAAVASACRLAGWPAPERPDCTSEPRWFSHRTRADRRRQTAVAWLTTPGRAVDGAVS